MKNKNLKILVISTMVIIIIMLIMNYLMSESFFLQVSELKLFECGFDSIYWHHNKISIHFFKIGIVFVMFDLEIMYLLMMFNNVNIFVEVWLILVFMLFTLFLEMYYKSLNWSFSNKKISV